MADIHQLASQVSAEMDEAHAVSQLHTLREQAEHAHQQVASMAGDTAEQRQARRACQCPGWPSGWIVAGGG